MATKKSNNPDSTAVILVSGKQYLVKVGDKIETEKIEAKPGDKISVKEVLLTVDGEKTEVGTPYLKGASVDLNFDKEFKADKVEIRKFKAKARYRRTTGHRQVKSHLTVTAINL